MDADRIIPGSIIVLVVVIPIVILKLKSTLRKKKITGSLDKLAQQHNTSIVKYDQWNDSAIGLGKDGSHVFVKRIDKHEEKGQAIALSVFNRCSVVNDKAGAAFKEGNFKVTNAIDLELTGKNNQVERINFYRIDKDDPLLTDELELAEKWCKIINESIAQRAWPSYAEAVK